MDVNGVEQVNLVALGGADNINVGDLTGTGVTDVNIDLSATSGSGVGDGQADTVTVNGTAHHDAITVAAMRAAPLSTVWRPGCKSPAPRPPTTA